MNIEFLEMNMYYPKMTTVKTLLGAVMGKGQKT